MAYRNKYITIKLPEADWESVRDIANLQGETLSTAGWNLIQRGVEGYEKEMGSSTPVRVQMRRLHNAVNARASLKKEMESTLQMITQEGGPEQEEQIKKVHDLAEKAGVNLT